MSFSILGNDVIHQLTKNENVTLYVAITLVSGVTKYQIYRRFSVADESDNFRLFLQKPEPNGTLGLIFSLYICVLLEYPSSPKIFHTGVKLIKC